MLFCFMDRVIELLLQCNCILVKKNQLFLDLHDIFLFIKLILGYFYLLGVDCLLKLAFISYAGGRCGMLKRILNYKKKRMEKKQAQHDARCILVELPEDPRIRRKHIFCPPGSSNQIERLHEDCLDEADMALRSIGLSFAEKDDDQAFCVKWVEK